MAFTVAQFEFDPNTGTIDPGTAFGVDLASLVVVVVGQQFTIQFAPENLQPDDRIQTIAEALSAADAGRSIVIAPLPNPLSGLDISLGVGAQLGLFSRFDAAGAVIAPAGGAGQGGLPLTGAVINPSPGVYQINITAATGISGGALLATAEGLIIGDGSYASAFFSGANQITVETNVTDPVTGVNTPTNMGFSVLVPIFDVTPGAAAGAYRFTVIRLGDPVVDGR